MFNKYTLELRYPFTTNPSSTIYGLTFFEAANGWYNYSDYNPFRLRRSVGVGGFLLGATGYTAAIHVHSPGAAIAFLALASGAHDLTLPVLWATTTDAGGRFGGTASGFVNFASTLSGMLAPLTAAGLERAFGSFHAVFYAAAGLYVLGAGLWLIIEPREPPPS